MDFKQIFSSGGGEIKDENADTLRVLKDEFLNLIKTAPEKVPSLFNEIKGTLQVQDQEKLISFLILELGKVKQYVVAIQLFTEAPRPKEGKRSLLDPQAISTITKAIEELAVEHLSNEAVIDPITEGLMQLFLLDQRKAILALFDSISDNIAKSIVVLSAFATIMSIFDEKTATELYVLIPQKLQPALIRDLNNLAVTDANLKALLPKLPFNAETILQASSQERKRQIIYNIFFDKVCTYQKDLTNKLKKLQGLTFEQSWSIFVSGLQKICHLKTSLQKQTEKTVANVLQWVKKSAYAMSHAEISSKILSLSLDAPNNSCLFPGNIEGHAVYFLVTKTAENKFSVILYNAGDGLELGHYKHPDQENKYQTYLAIHDIQEEELLSKIMALLDATEVKVLYDTMKELEKVGKKEPQVTDPDLMELYDSIQASGTCRVSALLALLRHQVLMQSPDPKVPPNVPPNVQENYVDYKVVKSLFRDVLWKVIGFTPIEGDELDRAIEDFALEKIATSARYFEFAEVASDNEKFKAAVAAYNTIFDENSNPDRLAVSLTKYAKVKFLDEQYKLAIKKWNREGKKLDELEEYKAIAVIKTAIAHYAIDLRKRAEIKERIESCLNKELPNTLDTLKQELDETELLIVTVQPMDMVANEKTELLGRLYDKLKELSQLSLS